MTIGRKPPPTWRVRNLRSNWEWEGVIMAYWEVHRDPISDDYTPHEIGARDLFKKWNRLVCGDYPNGLIPIYWSVRCEEHRIFESMPFQFNHLPITVSENFLTFFSWPVNPTTGKRLNWLTVPVQDKMWNSQRADKGGFIQQATGWKPAILQPFVYLGSLTEAAR